MDAPKLSPIDLLLIQSLQAYTALNQLDQAFSGDAQAPYSETARRIEDGCRALALAADVYARNTAEFLRVLADPQLVQRVLVHHADCDASAEDMRTIRADIHGGIRNLRQCAAEAQRLLLTARTAAWPVEAPEQWVKPLHIRQEFLSIAPREAVAAAEERHEIVVSVLNGITTADCSLDEKRTRRAQFIEKARPIILQTRWRVIRACTQGRDSDLLRALKTGALAIATPVSPASSN